jgi:undecaprenyl-diphosphatase
VNPLQSVVLGVVQGLTEFLPISSTAHLRIVPALFGWDDPGAAFTAVTQLGTMTAVLIYFRRDIARIVWTWLRSLRDPSLRGELDARLGWYIGLGTIPIGIFGFLFKDQIETGARNLTLIAGALILLALVLAYAERAGRRERGVQSLNLRDGVVIGAAQAVALIPGVSRSGSTISAGLFLGLRRADAARYSFLLSIPAVVLSGLFELRNIGDGSGPGAVSTIVATVLAFVVGYASIALLLRFLVNHSTLVFVGYRIALGVLVLALVATNVIS